MSAATVALLGIALVVAAVDWHAVATARTRLRPLTKTVPMVLLIAAALIQHREVSAEGATTERTVLVAGLDVGDLVLVPHDGPTLVFVLAIGAALLSLLGDVLLLPQVDQFIGGLVSFLLAHLAYVAAFVTLGLAWGVAAAALVLIGAALSPLVLRVVRSVRANEPPLVAPVAVYIGVICAMAATAAGTKAVLLALGAVIFCASDAQLAWNRFVRPSRTLEVGCISTYHLAQALLILGIAAA